MECRGGKLEASKTELVYNVGVAEGPYLKLAAEFPFLKQIKILQEIKKLQNEEENFFFFFIFGLSSPPHLPIIY